MTDMYGNEPHEQTGHEEAMGGDHAEVHEAPSDYEFADDGGATSEHSDEHVLPAAEAKPKGRSALLPIAAAVGGVLLLGGVAWWQFGSTLMSSNNADAVAQQQAAATQAMPMPAPTTPISQPSLEVTPKVADNTVVPAPAPAPVMAPVAQPVAEAPAPTPTPAPVPQLTTSASSVPAQPTPMIAAAPAANDQRLDALTSRIDDLQKSLGQVTQQLGQVSNMVAAAAPNKGIEDRLDRLEQQTAQNHHAAPTLSAPATLTVDDPGVSPAPASMSTLKPIHHKPVSATHAVPTHHATHTHKPVVIEGKEEPVHWVLRAAMPGQAWVATSANGSDLKPLHVGDMLASIGLVTAIEQKGGAWIVEGTKGTIR